MKTVYILVGVPGSGKSTWLQANEDTLDYPFKLSSDAIIDEIADMFGYIYDEIFTDVVNFANRVFLDKVDEASKEVTFIDIVIDRTNCGKKSRAPFLKKFKDFRKVAVVFPTPEKTEWERRLASRPGKTIPKYVLESMERNFEMPTLEEGFDEVIVVEN